MQKVRREETLLQGRSSNERKQYQTTKMENKQNGIRPPKEGENIHAKTTCKYAPNLQRRFELRVELRVWIKRRQHKPWLLHSWCVEYGRAAKNWITLVSSKLGWSQGRRTNAGSLQKEIAKGNARNQTTKTRGVCTMAWDTRDVSSKLGCIHPRRGQRWRVWTVEKEAKGRTN